MPYLNSRVENGGLTKSKGPGFPGPYAVNADYPAVLLSLELILQQTDPPQAVVEQSPGGVRHVEHAEVIILVIYLSLIHI